VLIIKESGKILNWSAHLIPGGDDLTWPLENWKSKIFGSSILAHCQIKLSSQGDISFTSLFQARKARRFWSCWEENGHVLKWTGRKTV
jgi:hypothetical protein